jgi:hypothetical protein
MARSRSGKRHSTGTTITTKSWFGSHEEMVVEDLGDGKVICEDSRGRYITDKDRLDVEDLGDGKVICEDSRGRYITDKDRLDNGLADQNRIF